MVVERGLVWDVVVEEFLGVGVLEGWGLGKGLKRGE